MTLSQAKSVCSPFVTNSEMQKNTSYTGVPLSPSSIAYPCGFKRIPIKYLAYLTFNDSFQLYDSAGARIPINESNLDPNSHSLFKSRPGTSN